MATTHERALALYYQLRPGAYAAYNNYVLVRTPPDLQADMDGILAPNQPKVMLSSGQLVPVVDYVGATVPGSPAVAEVVSPDEGKVKLQQVAG
jgi:hypothetical protein